MAWARITPGVAESKPVHVERLETFAPVHTGAGVGGASRGGRRDNALDAHERAPTQELTPERALRIRVIPWRASSAGRAPAPLPHPWRKGSRAHAVWRVNMEETARATGCARMVTAFPWPCWFSMRASKWCAAGCSRRKSPAASEKAHVRGALPICAPEGPERVPADSLAQLTRRPEEAHSCTRGKRARSCLSSRSTRRRIVPIPGTVCRRYRVLALA